MSNQISINKVTNANIYVDGRSFLGRAEEATLPIIKNKMSDHKALGMIGELEYAAGLEKMEMKIKWNSMYPEVMKKTANPFSSTSLQIRSSIDVWAGGARTEQKPLVVYITGQFKEVPLGTFKAQENVELESSVAVTYCKLEIDGETVVEIDVEANIYIVDGVDLMAQYRQNLGI
jgi:P2 family phage contractile tail tube protein